jgi:NAD(P)-dependent dehydrogenase (short-subunit alcohol dehydrogenase family)
VTGLRVVVVGASSGIGRCLATGLGARGAHVALLARRQDRLERAAQESGPNAVPIVCDVTDEQSVDAAITAAADALGGIDGLVYATGIGELARLVDHDVAMWQRAFATNVIGAWSVTKAVLPHLAQSQGSVAYLSSVSASITQPWPGLGSYAVSKAALDKLVEAWRAEHPQIGFTRVVVGDTAGGDGESLTEFANSWDQDVAAEVMPEWFARKYIAGTLMDIDELVRAVETVLRTGATVCIQSVTVAPRPAGP